jgi:hypothetical protein
LWVCGFLLCLFTEFPLSLLAEVLLTTCVLLVLINLIRFDLFLKSTNRLTEIASLVTQFLHLHLQVVSLICLLAQLCRSNQDSVLTQLISLLQINYELVLTSNNGMIFFNLLFVHVYLLILCKTNLIQKVC